MPVATPPCPLLRALRERLAPLLVLLLLPVLPAAGLAACSGESAEGTLARPPAADGTPTRVVCLACAATDIFDALGELDRVIAVEEDCPCPGTEGKVMIRNEDHPGKLAAFNVESVLALRPDAIIAHPDLRRALEGRGVPVVFTADHFTYANIDDLVYKIGDLLHMRERAQALLDHMRAKEAEIRARTKDLPRVKVYYEHTGMGWTAGSVPVVSSMIDLAGGVNIAGDVPRAWVTLTLEAIFAADPDVIVLGAFADPIEDVVKRPGWDRLKAVREGRVYHIPLARRNVAQGTPRCVDECERMFLPWFHPELDAPAGHD
jgi:iron complex transport system substrate-binding protein